MLSIKICGMKDPENIREIAALSPEFLGLIFYSGSPRCAHGLDPHLLKCLSPLTRKVGVFVNESPETIRHIANQYSLTTVQLHGEETPEECDRLEQDGFTVIKAFPIAGKNDFNLIKPYEKVCSYVLLDTKTPPQQQYGGTGISFDWSLLRYYSTELPFFLSGGISPDKMEEIRSIRHPFFYALDLNSRFETAPGMKDPEQINLFTEDIRKNYPGISF